MPQRLALSLAGLLAAGAPLHAGPGSPERPWAEILGPARGSWPPAAEEVRWREDLLDALDEAADSGRPLFVTLRCLPCKQCADFDRAVLEGGPELDPLLRRFVTVRLTDAAAADLRLLPMATHQDLDLSWWGYLFSDEGELYGVFGGRDAVSEETRISPAALARTLARVLDHHYDPRRKQWDVDGPPPDLSAPERTARDLPGYAAWSRERGGEGCLHCHQVQEVLRQPAIDTGTFDKTRDVYVWPLPENLGLVLDRDDGLRVTAVAAGSPAAKAGLRAGDSLGAADGVLLFGQADLRGVLHRGPAGAGAIDLVWTRDGALGRGRLELADGWRKTDLGWRMSLAQGNVGGRPGFAWANAVSPADRRRLGIPPGAMALRPWFGREPHDWPARAAGLRDDDVIVAVDGQSPDVAGRPFMLWFRLRHDPGDRVTLTVLDPRGRQRELAYSVPGPAKDS